MCSLTKLRMFRKVSDFTYLFQLPVWGNLNSNFTSLVEKSQFGQSALKLCFRSFCSSISLGTAVGTSWRIKIAENNKIFKIKHIWMNQVCQEFVNTLSAIIANFWHLTAVDVDHVWVMLTLQSLYFKH